MAGINWRGVFANIYDALLGGEPAAFAKLTSYGLQLECMLQSDSVVNFLSTGSYNVTVPDPGDGRKFRIRQWGILFDTLTGAPGGAQGAVTLKKNNGTTWLATSLPSNAVVNTVAAPDFISVGTSGPVVDPTIAPSITFQITTPFSGGTVTVASGRFLVWGAYEP